MGLYFVRHGQTEANARRIYDGQRLNAPLTETGKAQAAAVGQDLKSSGIERIISSPLHRTRQTAAIIAENLEGSVPIVLDERLMEYDNGDLAGTPYRELNVDEFLATTKGNESIDGFRARVSAALVEAHASPLNTLIVSHGGVYCQYVTLRDGLPAKSYWGLVELQNGQVEELTVNWQ